MFNVISHFYMIFNAEFISEAISNFQGFVIEKIQDGRHLMFDREQDYCHSYLRYI